MLRSEKLAQTCDPRGQSLKRMWDVGCGVQGSGIWGFEGLQGVYIRASDFGVGIGV